MDTSVFLTCKQSLDRRAQALLGDNRLRQFSYMQVGSHMKVRALQSDKKTRAFLLRASWVLQVCKQSLAEDVQALLRNKKHN